MHNCRCEGGVMLEFISENCILLNALMSLTVLFVFVRGGLFKSPIDAFFIFVISIAWPFGMLVSLIAFSNDIFNVLTKPRHFNFNRLFDNK